MQEIFVRIGLEETQTPGHILAFRICLAAILGGLIGLEREAHRRPAGLRTHILVATAAAIVVAVTFEIYATLAVEGQTHGNPDPLRAVEAVMAGIAFLGAGAIFRSSGDVKGLTTGAGLWLAGAVGLACATGYYLLALLATALALIVLYLLRHAEDRLFEDGEGRR